MREKKKEKKGDKEIRTNVYEKKKPESKSWRKKKEKEEERE